MTSQERLSISQAGVNELSSLASLSSIDLYQLQIMHSIVIYGSASRQQMLLERGQMLANQAETHNLSRGINSYINNNYQLIPKQKMEQQMIPVPFALYIYYPIILQPASVSVSISTQTPPPNQPTSPLLQKILQKLQPITPQRFPKMQKKLQYLFHKICKHQRREAKAIFNQIININNSRIQGGSQRVLRVFDCCWFVEQEMRVVMRRICWIRGKGLEVLGGKKMEVDVDVKREIKREMEMDMDMDMGMEREREEVKGKNRKEQERIDMVIVLVKELFKLTGGLKQNMMKKYEQEIDKKLPKQCQPQNSIQIQSTPTLTLTPTLAQQIPIQTQPQLSQQSQLSQLDFQKLEAEFPKLNINESESNVHILERNMKEIGEIGEIGGNRWNEGNGNGNGGMGISR